MQQTIPLELLAASEQGRILDIDGKADLVTRLEEMGLRAGTLVRMVQPGCPCIIAVNNHRLSYRANQAATILVETVSQYQPSPAGPPRV